MYRGPRAAQTPQMSQLLQISQMHRCVFLKLFLLMMHLRHDNPSPYYFMHNHLLQIHLTNVILSQVKIFSNQRLNMCLILSSNNWIVFKGLFEDDIASISLMRLTETKLVDSWSVTLSLCSRVFSIVVVMSIVVMSVVVMSVDWVSGDLQHPPEDEPQHDSSRDLLSHDMLAWSPDILSWAFLS